VSSRATITHDHARPRAPSSTGGTPTTSETQLLTIGRDFRAGLSSVPAVDLGALAHRQAGQALLCIAVGAVREVIMGCVLPAAWKQEPGSPGQPYEMDRLPRGYGAPPFNRLCGSGMKP